MTPITTITSTTIPLMKENIDTDQIIPKQFLKNILKVGYGDHLLTGATVIPTIRTRSSF